MHSWRLIPRCAAVCLSVVLVASGLFLTGAHDGWRTSSAHTDAAAQIPQSEPSQPAPDSEQPSPEPTGPTQSTPAPKAPVVTSEQTVVPAVVKTPTDPGRAKIVAELPDTTTKNFGMVGVTWSAATKETDVSVAIRTRTDGTWSAWQSLELDDTASGGRPGTEPIWVGRADGVAARVTTASGEKPEDIKVMTIDPGEGPADGSATEVTPASATAAAATSVEPAVYNPAAPIDGTAQAIQTTDGSPSYTAAPRIITRAQWGAAKNTPCDPPITGDSTHGAIVHHTAGSNSYTASESYAIVRGDQAYHMKGHGWCDIGYNFLVDKYGQIFEGRNGGMDRQVRAAHSGNGEVNTYAMGIAMAGNFEKTEPAAALKTSMVKLIGWRFGTNYKPAKGTYYVGQTITASQRYGAHTLNMISGHRNVVSTACPGAMGQAWIGAKGGLRDRVEAYIAHYSSAIKTEAKRLGTTKTGPVRIGEAVASTGRHTIFTKLDLWWSPKTGVRPMIDPMRGIYTSLKAEKSPLGFPTSTYSSNGKVGVQRFQSGVMVRVARGTSYPVYTLWGAIATSYKQLGEASGVLGTPTSSVGNYKTGVTRATFEKGYILYTASTHEAIAYNSAGVKIAAGTVSDGGVPAVTTGLKATPTTSSAKLTWAAASGAKYYGVCLKTEPTDKTCWRWWGNRTATSLDVTGLQPTAGTDYSFTVLAYNGAGFSRSAESPFNLLSAASTTSRPAVATGLRAAPWSSGAKLTWNAPAGATYYGVCLYTSGTQTACWKWYGGIKTTSLMLSGLKPTGGTDYFFTVLSYNKYGFSRSVKVGFNLTTTKPAVASGLTAQPSSSSVRLAWNPVSGADHYGVCLYTDAASTKCWKWFGSIAKPGLSVSGLAPTGGTDYFFTVLSYNRYGFSRTGKVGFNLTSSTSDSTAANTLTVPSTRSFTITGHGYGHGIGMSQYGAQGAATQGVKYDAILKYYYPGTALSSKTGNIRVLISKDTDPSVVVRARSGMSVRIIAGNKVIKLPATMGGATVTYWQIVPLSSKPTTSVLQYKTASWHTYNTAAWTGDAQFEAGSSAIRLVLPDHAEVAYRSTLRSAVPASGSSDRNTVNITSIDNYVRGVVSAEMPSSWKPEALKAQAVAARTYGVRSLSTRYYDICDTTACQVYGGVVRETTATDSAVSATAGKILTYGGTPAFTQFSSSSGGWSDAGNYAYLPRKVDAYDNWSGNSVHTWTLTVKAATLEQARPSIGTLKSLKITKRNGAGDWGGRVTSVTLTGTKASATLSGNDMRWALGLRSNWFRFN